MFLILFLMLCFFVFFIGIPFSLLLYIVRPAGLFIKKKPAVFTFEAESSHMENFTVTSFDGYKLNCTCIRAHKNKAGTGKFVVISHGYLSSRDRSARFAHLYTALNYNVVLYDLRSHGVNQRDFISLGCRESKDLLCVMQELKNRYGQGILVGLHGESMGAVTSLLVLQEQPFAFCVADCAFSDLAKLFKYMLHNQIHLPQFYLPLTDLFCRTFFHYSFFEIAPEKAIVKSSTPILFIHGEKDSLIPAQMSMDLYENAGAYKELEIIQKAQHASSLETAPEYYEHIVHQFLKNLSSQVKVMSEQEYQKAA